MVDYLQYRRVACISTGSKLVADRLTTRLRERGWGVEKGQGWTARRQHRHVGDMPVPLDIVCKFSFAGVLFFMVLINNSK
jgi:hypothetical protein